MLQDPKERLLKAKEFLDMGIYTAEEFAALAEPRRHTQGTAKTCRQSPQLDSMKINIIKSRNSSYNTIYLCQEFLGREEFLGVS